MHREIEKDEAERTLESFSEWVEENASRAMLRWARHWLPYEYSRSLDLKKLVNRSAAKGWDKTLPKAIEGYKDFIGRIRKEWDRVERIRVGSKG